MSGVVEPVARDVRSAWVKRVLGVDLPKTGPGGSSPVAVNIAKHDAAAALEQLKIRFATVVKTYAYALKQAPDEQARILGDLQSALGWAVKDIQELDPSIAIPTNVTELQGRITTTLGGLGAEFIKKVTARAKGWTDRANALITAPAPASAGEKKTQGAALLAAIGDIEQGAGLDRGVAARLKADVAGVLNPVDALVVRLRTLYTATLPTRTKVSGTAVAPSDAPAVTRPAVPGLSEANALKLNGLIGNAEGQMAQSRAPNADEVAEAAKLVGDALAADGGLDCEQEYKDRKTWKAVKERFKELSATSAEAGKTYMSRMWWFRRKTVDGEMAALQKTFGFTWGSVGSANLESDYDVTVRTHGTQGAEPPPRDFEIVGKFNTALQKKFTSPPGIVFDTNLYAEATVDLAVPENPTATQKNMGKMKEAGQDVGALMKMRRYMDWEQFEAFKNKTLEGMPADARAEARAQFEEADDLFFLSQVKRLEKAGIEVPKDLSPAGQAELLKTADELDHNEAKAMQVNNELYLEAVQDVRKIEAALDKERDPDKQAALFAKMRTLQADATFFAAEAYHSEGPLKHIVQAAQSSAVAVKNDPEWNTKAEGVQKAEIDRRTNAALSGLTTAQMMQSFNENLGDMLKDLHHYESESPSPGLGFYRSSKYLERLCDAMEWIEKKIGDPATLGEFQAIKIGGQDKSAVKRGVGGLVAIRGGKKTFKGPGEQGGVPDPEDEKEAYAIEEMGRVLPGVSTLRDLAKLVTGLAQEVNTVLRKQEMALKIKAAEAGPYFK